jgi:hypothetical protein
LEVSHEPPSFVNTLVLDCKSDITQEQTLRTVLDMSMELDLMTGLSELIGMLDLWREDSTGVVKLVDR